MKSLTRMGSSFVLAVAALLIASPAFAQFTPTLFKARIELLCKDDEDPSSNKLTNYKLENREWIALCNGLDPDDPADKNAINDADDAQRVVFDHVDHRVLVVDKCSLETVCAWHFAPDHDEACAQVSTGTPLDGTLTSACAYPLEDLRDANGQSIANIHGEIFCKLKQTFDPADDDTAKSNCDGALGLFDGLNVHDFGDPCQVEVNTPGPEYHPPASCDPL